MSIYIFNIGLGGRESAFLFLGDIWGGKWVWLTDAVNKPRPAWTLARDTDPDLANFCNIFVIFVTIL